MNTLTEQFLNLILEKESKDKKPDEKPDEKEVSSSSFKKIEGTTSNKLSLGKPITDAGLSGMKDRANDPKEAGELLKDLGLKSVGGSNVYEVLYNLYGKAASSDLKVLVSGVELVKDAKDKKGVKISLKGVWNQDDKGGKRSYGYIRSLLVAALNSGMVSLPARDKNKLRIELIDGSSDLVAYVGKSKSWGVE
mgnify:CR=1 FL=1|tara:strand:- start:92 stop:670 length:579 start_codon:yes stop_codon:yes gene_type:complete